MKYLKLWETYHSTKNPIFDGVLNWTYNSLLDLGLYFKTVEDRIEPYELVDVKGSKKNKHGEPVGISPRFKMIEKSFGLSNDTFKIEFTNHELPLQENKPLQGTIKINGKVLFTFTSELKSIKIDGEEDLKWIISWDDFSANLRDRLNQIFLVVFVKNKEAFTERGLQRLLEHKHESAN